MYIIIKLSSLFPETCFSNCIYWYYVQGDFSHGAILVVNKRLYRPCMQDRWMFHSVDSNKHYSGCALTNLLIVISHTCTPF